MDSEKSKNLFEMKSNKLLNIYTIPYQFFGIITILEDSRVKPGTFLFLATYAK